MPLVAEGAKNLYSISENRHLDPYDFRKKCYISCSRPRWPLESNSKRTFSSHFPSGASSHLPLSSYGWNSAEK